MDHGDVMQAMHLFTLPCSKYSASIGTRSGTGALAPQIL